MSSQNYTAIVNSFVKFNSKNNFLRHFLIGGRLRWLTDNTSFDIYVSFSEICDFAIDNSNPKGDSQFPDKKQFYKKNCMTFFDLRTSSKLTDTPIFFPKCTLFRAASYYYYDYSHFECKKRFLIWYFLLDVVLFR